MKNEDLYVVNGAYNTLTGGEFVGVSVLTTRMLPRQFDRWSDSQRRAVLQDLVLSCSTQQLAFLSGTVSRRLPLQAADFTCMLPRSLCVYLFSFLDPRSLCRCARVRFNVSICRKSKKNVDRKKLLLFVLTLVDL